MRAKRLIGCLKDCLRQGLKGACERSLQSRHFIQKHAQAPSVSLVVVRLLPDDLRAQIIRRANARYCELAGGLQEPHETKITEQSAASSAQENVPRLDVAVHHLVRVHVANCIRHLCEALQHCGLLKGYLRPRTLFDRSAEVPSVGKIHYKAQPSGPHKHLSESDHIRMPYASQRHGLSNSCVPRLGIHFLHADLLHHAELVGCQVSRQESLAKGSLSEQPQPSVCRLVILARRHVQLSGSLALSPTHLRSRGHFVRGHSAFTTSLASAQPSGPLWSGPLWSGARAPSAGAGLEEGRP
mmetsp:Transcript_6229/g.11339  ORF Transcript_6229/g.11339 Transcript_6229/m.11339 type:complete len:298 (+) Transcript_6229:514-1407(+)